MEKYRLTRKSGDIIEFESDLTLGQAAQKCIQLVQANGFIRSLVSKYVQNGKLSPVQTGWLIYIAREQIKKEKRKIKRASVLKEQEDEA